MRDSDSGETVVAGLLLLVKAAACVCPSKADSPDTTMYVLPGSNLVTSRQAFSVAACLCNRSPNGLAIGSRGDRMSVLRPCLGTAFVPVTPDALAMPLLP